MLTIQCPEFCTAEISYITEVLLKDRLGVEYTISRSPRTTFSIERANKSISLNADFFETLHTNGKVETNALSTLPLWDSNEASWDLPLIDHTIPILFGDAKVTEDPDHVQIGFDIFGAAFFMLSRYEEVDATSTDTYGRFLAKDSLAYRGDFLMRPIIDEYIEILWCALKSLWPDLNRKKESYRIVPTHDVDIPFLNIILNDLKAVIKRIGGDVLFRKNPALACRTLLAWVRYKCTGKMRYASDTFDIFDRLLELSDKHHIKNKFYFMAVKEKGWPLPGRYDILSKEIRQLIEEISSRGHEIGMHPTGTSYQDADAFSKQAEAYFAMKTALNLDGPSGGRQHYVLWDPIKTPANWEKSGFDYDSTMTYADHVGFRCGTCKEYYLWDHGERRKMAILEHPLIMMEGSLLSTFGMNRSNQEANGIIRHLKHACQQVDGVFVFLWHNGSFSTEADWETYELCLTQD
jgi:peptidoglycan/xylan/chitin deacetylase (PgdA/CDA1 family)